MNTKKPFCVLLYNIGYATGLDGSMRSYLLRWYRYIYTPRAIIRKVRQSIYSLLNRENPDLCCFIEIHRRHGFVPHPHAYTPHIDNKYGRFSVLRYLPFFRDNCNGFFSHHQLTLNKRYFKNGSKKLIYEIQVGNGMCIFLVHFALSLKVRKKQCQELKAMLKGRDNVIVCGDFNIFKGMRELQALADSCSLNIINSHGATFPAANPKRTLDLFLCPKSLGNVSAEVMSDIQVSDHLPVMLTVG